jgi:uncharacterized protein YecE (DUF72 family)
MGDCFTTHDIESAVNDAVKEAVADGTLVLRNKRLADLPAKLEEIKTEIELTQLTVKKEEKPPARAPAPVPVKAPVVKKEEKGKADTNEALFKEWVRKVAGLWTGSFSYLYNPWSYVDSDQTRQLLRDMEKKKDWDFDKSVRATQKNNQTLEIIKKK